MFLKFHTHIRLRHPFLRYWRSNEEIVLLVKYSTVFHCPMFCWERCLDQRKEVLSIYCKIRAIRTLYTTKLKYFILVSCRKKNRLVRDSLAVWIWLEGISSAIQKGWNLKKMYPSYKHLRGSIIFLSAYWIFQPFYFNFLYVQKLKITASVLMRKILS